jgi:hypothetical protein
MKNFENLHLKLALIAVYLCFCLGCSKKAIQPTSSISSAIADDAQKRMCKAGLDAAKKVLGDHAEILKCGALNNPQVQEVVAALSMEHSQGTRATGLAVSQLVILRHEASGWKTALTVSKQIQNGSGFVGIDYIDDSAPFYGYRVLLSDQRDDGKKAFTLSFSYLGKDGNSEGIPLEISWDDAIGRYREFNVNSDPPGFKPEIKRPPHLKH